MNTLFIITSIFAIIGLTLVILQKTKVIGDRDGDLIPDVVEDKAAAVKKVVNKKITNVKTKVKKVAKEVNDVKVAVKAVVKESADVINAVTGKVTKESLRSMTKEELIDSAKTKFGVDLSNSETKTNLINKVYALYHKK